MESGPVQWLKSLAWVAVLAVAASLLAAVGYTSRDPDSTVYSEISARLADLPVASWIAPDWGGSWERTGLFREHPAGIFVLPSLLARLGYPPLQAAFAVGAAFSALAVILVRYAIAPLVKPHEAVAAQWAALIFPVAFTYRIRANQEYPVLVFTLAGLYALHRSRVLPMWITGVVAATCGLALFKGIFVVFLPIVCGLWLILIPNPSQRSDRGAWIGIAVSVLTVVGCASLYEQAYHRVTGDSFLAFYLHDRIGKNAGMVDGGSFHLMTKLGNVVFYLRRVLWFAVPGSVVLLLSAPRLRRASYDELRGVLFAVVSMCAYIGAMSLGANRAERFIFPAYFLIGCAGAVVAMRRWAAVDRLTLRIAALPPYAMPLAWLALFLMTLATGRRLPYVEMSSLVIGL